MFYRIVWCCVPLTLSFHMKLDLHFSPTLSILRWITVCFHICKINENEFSCHQAIVKSFWKVKFQSTDYFYFHWNYLLTNEYEINIWRINIYMYMPTCSLRLNLFDGEHDAVWRIAVISTFIDTIFKHGVWLSHLSFLFYSPHLSTRWYIF